MRRRGRLYSLWGAQAGVGVLEMQQVWTQDVGGGGELDDHDGSDGDCDQDKDECDEKDSEMQIKKTRLPKF